MNQGQFPEDRRPGRGRGPRPSRQMRARAEQMAELLDQAAARPARSRRRGAASLSGALLGLSAIAIGGVGVVLGLDPESAGQQLSLPGLHHGPGATDVLGPPGAQGATGAPADGVDASTGVAPLTDGPHPTALPAAASPPAASPGNVPPVTPDPTTPATTTGPTTTGPITRRGPGPPGHPTTSPRSGRPGTHPPVTHQPGTRSTATTARSAAPTPPPGAGLPHADSRASAPSLSSGGATGTASRTSRTSDPPRRPGGSTAQRSGSGGR